MNTAPTELETLVRARYPILQITSYEEDRVEQALAEVATRRGKNLVCWSITRGLYGHGESLTKSKRAFSASTTDPVTALDEVIRQVDPTIFLLWDLHPFLKDHSVVRKLRELAHHLKSSPKTLVMVSPEMLIPPELEKDITPVEFPLPNLDEMGDLLDGIVTDIKEHGQMELSVTPQDREKLLKAAMGLTLKEAENAFARAVVQRGKLSSGELPLILGEKKRVIQKSGILEYYEAAESLDDVGGLDGLKEWVRKRSVAFTEEARRFGLSAPKGLLLLGVQGCGKSLSARAISAVWNLPLLRLDMGRIFSSLVGSSEENMRKAIATAESVAPSLLWIDEIDKAFAGMQGGNSDGGTGSRVLGTFLTWLQEKDTPVFVIATANNIANLPPELLRKGRLDEIFFVDLPDEYERHEIFKIHLERRGRAPQDYDLVELAARADGFSGSEIEQVVNSALYDAFDQKAELHEDHLLHSMSECVPLSTTRKEEIEHLRNWATTRTRSASKLREPQEARTSTPFRRLEL
jgi:SpoVK/Ycf46/Vps4 family AAA+-type ATPase